MSMTTNTFGAPAPVAAPAVAPPPTETAPESSRRTVIILAVVAAALALGIGAYFLLFAGDSTVPVSTPVAPAAPQAGPTAAPAPPPIAKYVAKKARNPFTPLVVAPVGAAGGSTLPGTPGVSSLPAGSTTTGTTSGAAPGTTGTTPGTTTGTLGGGTAPGTTTGTVPLPAPTPAPAPTPLTSSKPVAVSVMAVDYVKRTASIKVDRTTYDRTIGESFATYFKLIGVTKSGCAYVQYGGVAMPLCVGQPVTLQ